MIEKMKEMAALSRTVVEHWKDAAARNTIQASEQLELAEKKDQAEATALRNQAKQSLSRVKSDLAELGKANTAQYILLSNLMRDNIEWHGTTGIATQPSAPDKPTDDKQ